MEHVESMVFDAKGQAKESGMQVLWQCYFRWVKAQSIRHTNSYHSCSHIFAHKCKKVESKCFQSLSNHHATQ